MGAEIVFSVGRLDMEGALATAHQLEELPPAECYVIDFAKLGWVEPFGMLYFARQLRAFADRRKPARCRAVNHERHGYPAYMGFFKTFGLPFGNTPGQAPGSDRYIPLTGLLIRDLHIEAGQGSVDVREVIEARAGQMAAVLARGEAGRVHQTLSFSLREILRNVVEHANADHIWYCAQHWPDKAEVELAILDQGDGIRNSLSRNPHLSIRSDEDAVRLALMPGVSGVAFAGGRQRRTDEWANSGYGLFMTSELCARGGSFMICSGAAALLREGEREVVLASSLGGTALRLKMSVPAIAELGVTLAALSKKGESIATEFAPDASVRPSKSSRMLSSDFPTGS
jgi:hypothetical protein